MPGRGRRMDGQVEEVFSATDECADSSSSSEDVSPVCSCAASAAWLAWLGKRERALDEHLRLVLSEDVGAEAERDARQADIAE